jgi:ribonuclease VapC
MLLGEPEAETFVELLEDHGSAITSPVSVFETVAALVRARECSVSDARVVVSDLLNDCNISIAPVTAETGEAAITAFDRFGKGRHHAQLNLGDCFSYAIAKTQRLPILFKGEDFSQTDLEFAA